MAANFSPEHFKSNSIPEMIKSIVAKVKKAPDIKAVRNMQMYFGNHLLEGVPFDVSEHYGNTYVSVYYYAQHMVEPDVSIVPIHNIMSVRIPMHEFYKDLVLKPGPWTHNLDEAPSKLNIERKGVELGQTWKKTVQFNWGGKETDPAARLYVYKTLVTCEKLFQDLTKDTLGQEALEKIKTVQFNFQSSDSLKVENSSSTLSITVGLSVDLNKLERELNDNFNKVL